MTTRSAPLPLSVTVTVTVTRPACGLRLASLRASAGARAACQCTLHTTQDARGINLNIRWTNNKPEASVPLKLPESFLGPRQLTRQQHNGHLETAAEESRRVREGHSALGLTALG